MAVYANFARNIENKKKFNIIGVGAEPPDAGKILRFSLFLSLVPLIYPQNGGGGRATPVLLFGKIPEFIIEPKFHHTFLYVRLMFRL